MVEGVRQCLYPPTTDPPSDHLSALEGFAVVEAVQQLSTVEITAMHLYCKTVGQLFSSLLRDDVVVGWREGTAISIDIDIPIHAHVTIMEGRIIIVAFITILGGS